MCNQTGLNAHQVFLQDLLACGPLNEPLYHVAHAKAQGLVASLFDEEMLAMLDKSVSKIFIELATLDKLDPCRQERIPDLLLILNWMATYSRASCLISYQIAVKFSSEVTVPADPKTAHLFWVLNKELMMGLAASADKLAVY